MATTRLRLYNGALLICEERKLASLTENREPRHLLDEVWNDGGVRYCLEQAQWKFAMRTAQMEYEPSVQPSFGYRYAFPKPTDWIVTSAVCQDEYFNSPLLQYSDEIQYWFADITPIYVKFVSDDTDYGANLANWPSTFTEYVKTYFAAKIVGKLSGKTALRDRIWQKRSGLLDQMLLTAKNKDAMAGPTTFPARGSWTRSRFGPGRGGPLGDGGSPGSLIG